MQLSNEDLMTFKCLMDHVEAKDVLKHRKGAFYYQVWIPNSGVLGKILTELNWTPLDQEFIVYGPKALVDYVQSIDGSCKAKCLGDGAEKVVKS